jgi:hypothetical protein
MLVFPQATLAEACFYLLSASSLGPYERTARRLARSIEVQELLQAAGSDDAASLISEVRSRWGQLASSSLREPQECELAILLVRLASLADPSVEHLLTTIATYDQPPLAWPSALARSLMHSRPSTDEITFPTSVSTSPQTEMPEDLSDDHVETYASGAFWSSVMPGHIVADESLVAA